MSCSTNKGLSLLETLFAIGILTLILAFSFGPITSIKERQTLTKDLEKVEALIQEARTKTLSSDGGVRYGIHFDTSSATLFSGSVYNLTESSNKILNLSGSTNISDISLSGGGSNLVFNRITGDTDNSGTITISLIENPLRFKIITIFPLGTFFTE